jgi:hypothetical protein
MRATRSSAALPSIAMAGTWSGSARPAIRRAARSMSAADRTGIGVSAASARAGGAFGAANRSLRNGTASGLAASTGRSRGSGGTVAGVAPEVAGSGASLSPNSALRISAFWSRSRWSCRAIASPMLDTPAPKARRPSPTAVKS